MKKKIKGKKKHKLLGNVASSSSVKSEKARAREGKAVQKSGL